MERHIKESYFEFAGMTLIYLFFVIFIPLIPVFVLIFKKLQMTFDEFHQLDNHSAHLYKDYCRCVPRIFSGIPPYLFSNNRLVFIKNFSKKYLTANDFNRIYIKRVYYTSPNKCIVTFYQDKKIIEKLTFFESRHPAVDFLLKHIHLVHQTVLIEEAKNRRWWGWRK